MLLLNICNAWTDIALSTPVLWAAIHLDGRPVLDQSSLLGAWFERAGSRALSISLPKKLTGDMAAAITRHADQLQDLMMIYDTETIALVTGAGPFMGLKTLSTGFQGEDASTRAMMEMFRTSPNLVECTFDGGFWEEEDYRHNAEILVLPYMQHLKFGKFPGSPNSAVILDYISTPRLQTLIFPCDPDFQTLLRFLRRSSPPLQKLVLGSNHRITDWTRQEMQECLSLLPDLAQVELIQPVDHAADHFVAILADSPDLVPKLTSISLRWFNPSAPWYQSLATALSVRQKRIKFVQVELYNPTGLAEDVCVALRHLAADGMSIYVGTKDRNYI
ncbi:hypothetical protein DFH09DRAFT_1189045 [Mycena vulgaris]|nr:hypothetical protein DFH09DRAFT_1189045 [Mycena vulgaris]